MLFTDTLGGLKELNSLFLMCSKMTNTPINVCHPLNLWWRNGLLLAIGCGGVWSSFYQFSSSAPGLFPLLWVMVWWQRAHPVLNFVWVRLKCQKKDKHVKKVWRSGLLGICAPSPCQYRCVWSTWSHKIILNFVGNIFKACENHPTWTVQFSIMGSSLCVNSEMEEYLPLTGWMLG